jgi:hypothetical protein
VIALLVLSLIVPVGCACGPNPAQPCADDGIEPCETAYHCRQRRCPLVSLGQGVLYTVGIIPMSMGAAAWLLAMAAEPNPSHCTCPSEPVYAPCAPPVEPCPPPEAGS